MASTPGSESFMASDEIIGIAVIAIGVLICIIRLLCKKRKKRRKDIENELELPLPNKTAADHLEELKGATRRVVHSLIISTPREPQSPLDNSILFPMPQEEERKSSSNVNTTRSSKSINFDRKVESSLGSLELSKNNSKHGSIVGSLRGDSLTIKSQNSRSSQEPPTTPLNFQDDVIEVEPIRMSLINTLFSNISKYAFRLSSPSKISSRVPSKAQSPIESQIQSRMVSRKPSLETNPSISLQSASSSSQSSSRISLQISSP